MTYPTRKWLSLMAVLVLAALLFAVSLVNSRPSLAHPEGPEHEPVKPNKEELVKRFQKDQQAPPNLPR